MSMFMQALFEGIINGSTLALVAMGIALVWGVMGILSFTQGEFLMIAMFCSFYLNLYFGLDPIVSLPICMAIMFGIGFIVYKLIIARALRGPVLSQRLITFALSMVLVNLALLLFSGDFKTIPEVAISGSIDLGFMVPVPQQDTYRKGHPRNIHEQDSCRLGGNQPGKDIRTCIWFISGHSRSSRMCTDLFLLHLSQCGSQFPAVRIHRRCNGRFWKHTGRLLWRTYYGAG